MPSLFRQKLVFVLLLLLPLSACASIQFEPEMEVQDRVFFVNSRKDGPVAIESISMTGQDQQLLAFKVNNFKQEYASQDPVQIAIAPNGKQLLFASYWNQRPNLSVMNINGTAWRQLTNSPEAEYAPRWSPDGKRIVYVKHFVEKNAREIWLMNADGSEQRALVKNRICDSPRWSPDGQRLLFVCKDPDTAQAQIFTLRPKGESPRSPLTRNDYHSLEPQWSPDGKFVAYVAYRQGYDAGTSEIELIPSSGGTPQVLTQLDQSSFAIRWAPDGKSMLFASMPAQSEGAQVQVYHLDLETGAVQQLTQGDWSHAAPVWSRQGDRFLCWAYNYELAEHTRLEIYNKQGQLMKTLIPRHGKAFNPAWNQ